MRNANYGYPDEIGSPADKWRPEFYSLETSQSNAELKQALQDDATDLWKVTNAIKKEIKAREWIMEGRGMYAWDDDRYREETRLAFEAILKLIKDVQHPAQRRFHKVMKLIV